MDERDEPKGEARPLQPTGSEAAVGVSLGVVKGEGQGRGLPKVKQAEEHPEHFAPGGPRAGQDAGLSREEVGALYGRLEDGLDELFTRGAIDKAERDRRRRFIRRAQKGTSLFRCNCGVVFGGGSGNCPACGTFVECAFGPDKALTNAAMWKLQSGLYRKLFAEFQADMLRVGADAKGAPAKVAERKPSRPAWERPAEGWAFPPISGDEEGDAEGLGALIFGPGDGPRSDDGDDDDPLPEPPQQAPTATERGEKLGIRPVK